MKPQKIEKERRKIFESVCWYVCVYICFLEREMRGELVYFSTKDNEWVVLEKFHSN